MLPGTDGTRPVSSKKSRPRSLVETYPRGHSLASPQLEHGYTPLSNELLEALLRTRLSAREQKCLLAVARETFGWSRKAAGVTAYRVATLTLIGRTQAARTLAGLKARNILVNGAEGLGLQKDYDRWLPPTRFKLNPVQTEPGSTRTGFDLNPKTRFKLNRVTRFKLNPLKTIKQENCGEATASPHQTLIREFVQLFTEKFGAPPEIVGGRDGKIAADLLKRRPLDELLVLLRGFFRVGTKFTRERGAYSLPVFKAQINDLLVMRHNGEL